MRRAFTATCGLLWAVALVVVAPPGAIAVPTLTVDVFEDTFDGSCDDGDCSLRDALAIVDAGGTVRVPPGFYALSLTGAVRTRAMSTSIAPCGSSGSARPGASWTRPDWATASSTSTRTSRSTISRC